MDFRYPTLQARHMACSGVSRKITMVAEILYGKDTPLYNQCRQRAFKSLPLYRPLTEKEKAERAVAMMLFEEDDYNRSCRRVETNGLLRARLIGKRGRDD